MNSHRDKKMLLAFISILVGAMIMAGCVVFSLIQISNSINLISIQENKIFNISQLNGDILLQNKALSNYIVTRETGYLNQFRQLARTNLQLENQLIEIIKEPRKPLARSVKILNERYNRLCEEQVVPLVQKGNMLPAGLWNDLIGLEEALQNSTKEIQDMRLTDSAVITSSAVTRSQFTSKMSIMFSLVGLIAGITASVVTWRKFSGEHTNNCAILNTTRNAVITIERNGKIISFNRVAEELFEIDRSLVLWKKYKDVFARERSVITVKFILPVEEVMASCKGRCNQEFFYTAPDGWEMVLNIDCLPLENKKPTGVVLIARDITQRKVMEEKLYSLTLRDSLTRLFNHAYLHEILVNELRRCGEQDKQLAFILLDIDNFKTYNDNFGHPIGDELLKEFARVLVKNTRSTDFVGRYGGDEFGIILPDTGYELAEQISERLRRKIAEYPFPNGELLPEGGLTASIGVAFFPSHAVTAQELIKLADEAMYYAKRNSKNQVQLYFRAIKQFQQQLRNNDDDLLQTLNALRTIIYANNRNIYIHSEKVAEYAEMIAKELKIATEELQEIKVAAFLHDLGKLEIPNKILLKNGKLTDSEWEIIGQHPRLGSNMLRSFPQFKNTMPDILHHHERYDGKGYPDGLAGEKIPLSTRIITVADSFDAMISTRPYKNSFTLQEAISELRKNSGSQFDPGVAETLIKIIESKFKGMAEIKAG